MSPYIHRSIKIAMSLTCVIAIAGCSNHSTPSETNANSVNISAPVAGAPQPGQKLFATPEDAAAMLKDAVVTKDRPLLISIFGAEGTQLVFTGDKIEESHDMESFGNHMTEYLRVDHPNADSAVLHIGQENWPFPIPVVKSNGQWFFDTVAGKDELLNRRIGGNELNAIDVCRAYFAAQKQYARTDRTGDKLIQYAQHFRSTEGKKDGLYWAVGAGEPLSPLGPLVAGAQEEGYMQQPKNGEPHPYHGYIFHILKAQGVAAAGGKMSYLEADHMTKGFALIASPSAWGSSGIMTFMVGPDGKVYEKNLGSETRDLVRQIQEFNPDKTWTEVKD